PGQALVGADHPALLQYRAALFCPVQHPHGIPSSLLSGAMLWGMEGLHKLFDGGARPEAVAGFQAKVC
ncbi:MAG: hypothetical protein Q8Q74_01115, partial [Polaromonas sp.]|nr:hypothetical protein [Polaromonas sp.]